MFPCAIDFKTNHPSVYLQWIGIFGIVTVPHHIISRGLANPKSPARPPFAAPVCDGFYLCRMVMGEDRFPWNPKRWNHTTLRVCSLCETRLYLLDWYRPNRVFDSGRSHEKITSRRSVRMIVENSLYSKTLLTTTESLSLLGLYSLRRRRLISIGFPL